MEEKTFITSISTVIAIVVLAVISALIISSITSTDLLDCTNLSSSSSGNLTFESTSTLSPIGDGVSSSEVKANNRTWINCTTSDSLVVEITESKATVSVWFANETTDWTSIIKSDGDIYIDGVLNPSWTFLPFFLAGDIITFCKSDASTFLDVSVDAIRVYEQALNSTEVTEVFNYGR